jgi:hypothetical protein
VRRLARLPLESDSTPNGSRRITFGSMDLTSSCTRWPGSCFSYRSSVCRGVCGVAMSVVG